MTMPWWQYFGAHHAPFARQIAVEHLFPAAPLVECRARMAAVVEEPGLFVLTGESGVGKSTALRAALHPLNPTHYDGCYLAVGEAWTPYTFYQALALALHVPLPARILPLEQAIRDALWNSATQQGRRPVLVLDEAHWLTVPLFNTLRRLLHCAMDTTAPFALILAGHTELRQQRALRPLEAMRQRMTLAYHLLSPAMKRRPISNTTYSTSAWSAPCSPRRPWPPATSGPKGCRAGSTGGRRPVS